jgi:hypothetical protein
VAAARLHRSLWRRAPLFIRTAERKARRACGVVHQVAGRALRAGAKRRGVIAEGTTRCRTGACLPVPCQPAAGRDLDRHADAAWSHCALRRCGRQPSGRARSTLARDEPACDRSCGRLPAPMALRRACPRR